MRMRTVATTALVMLAGTLAVAQTVTYDYDRTVDFSRFRTYAWVPGTNLEDGLNHRRVVNAVDEQLASKGLTRVEGSAEADLLVAYHASFDRELQITGVSSGWGPYSLAGNRFASARAERVLVGTLVVEAAAAATKTLVWRGVASTDIDPGANSEKREKNIKRAAAKLFKHYPPANK